jgi:hypothetical protein
MIKDVTAALQACLSAELSETIDALTTLNKHFGRETGSIALGEVPESLVAAYSGAGKRHRNTKVQSSRGRSCTGEEACSVSPRSRLVEVGRRIPGGAARRRDFPHGPRSPRSFDPSCSEKQVGIGSISQTPELATLFHNNGSAKQRDRRLTKIGRPMSVLGGRQEEISSC